MAVLDNQQAEKQQNLSCDVGVSFLPVFLFVRLPKVPNAQVLWITESESLRFKSSLLVSTLWCNIDGDCTVTVCSFSIPVM